MEPQGKNISVAARRCLEQFSIQRALCVSQQQQSVQRQQQQGFSLCEGDRDDVNVHHCRAERIFPRRYSESQYEAHLRLPVFAPVGRENEHGAVAGLVRRKPECPFDCCGALIDWNAVVIRN